MSSLAMGSNKSGGSQGQQVFGQFHQSSHPAKSNEMAMMTTMLSGSNNNSSSSTSNQKLTAGLNTSSQMFANLHQQQQNVSNQNNNQNYDPMLGNNNSTSNDTNGANTTATGIKFGLVPSDHPDADKWFYLDPQNNVQGPFSTEQMAVWCQAGYFSLNLMMKRGSDPKFVPFGKF